MRAREGMRAAGLGLRAAGMGVVIGVGSLLCPTVGHAQVPMPGSIALAEAEIAAELIGAPVFAADGPQVGEVADVETDEDGQPIRIRMTAGAILGLGARTVELPPKSFTVLRGAVVIDLPAEVVQALPSLAGRPREE
jgi:sporulation protein YlmC with PRC-barrel domain